MYTLPKGTEITAEVIKNAIKDHEEKLGELSRAKDYYSGEHPILKRAKAQALKNNKLVINHAEYITDLFVGYLVGNPIDYQAEDNIDIDPILEAYRKQTIEKIDSEIATDASIYGKGFELVYANENNEPKSAKIDAKNCFVVYDDTVEHGKLFAITYDTFDSVKKKYKNVKVYTDSESREYTDDLVSFEKKDHSFGQVPVIEYSNNQHQKGDFKSVISLINAYNKLQSDRVNDKEQLIEAILVLYGFKLTSEQLTQIKEHRVMSAPKKTDGTGAEYLVKQLDENGVEILRKNLERDIHKISKTPNMSDENFFGNVSGVAMKFKLLPFEWATNTKERYFTVGLRERFTLYNTYLNKLNKRMPLVEVHKIKPVFKRNLPQNDLETSQVINNLSDKVSDQTLINQISFIKDAKAEIEAKDEERQKKMSIIGDQFGNNQPNGQPDPNQDNNSDNSTL